MKNKQAHNDCNNETNDFENYKVICEETQEADDSAVILYETSEVANGAANFFDVHENTEDTNTNHNLIKNTEDNQVHDESTYENYYVVENAGGNQIPYHHMENTEEKIPENIDANHNGIKDIDENAFSDKSLTTATVITTECK